MILPLSVVSVTYPGKPRASGDDPDERYNLPGGRE